MKRGEQNTNSGTPAAATRLLRVLEAARRLGVSKGKIYAMIRRGALQAVDVDGALRVCPHHLEKGIANGSFAPVDPTAPERVARITSKPPARRTKAGKGRKA